METRTSKRLALKKLDSNSVDSIDRENTVPEYFLFNRTPRIILNKLEITEIDSYKDTIKNEKKQVKPKTRFEYDIDDVNSGDSTDDDKEPKKIVPKWAKTATEKGNVQIFIKRELFLRWITVPECRRCSIKTVFK